MASTTRTLLKRSEWFGSWNERKVTLVCRDANASAARLTWEGGAQPGFVELDENLFASITLHDNSGGLTLVVRTANRVLYFRNPQRQNGDQISVDKWCAAITVAQSASLVQESAHVDPLWGSAGTLVRRNESGQLELRLDNSHDTRTVAVKELAHALVHSNKPRHPTGTKVLLLHEHMLVDATVDAHLSGARHRLELASGTALEIDLNILNHAASELDARAYVGAIHSHCQQLVASTEMVEDAITTVRLKVSEQLIHISTVTSHGVQRDEWRALTGLSELAPLLVAPSDRMRGERDIPPVLVRAGPGTGKTWSAQQLAHRLATDSGTTDSAMCSVPVLLYVQRLARFVRSSRSTKPADFLRLYLECECADATQRDMLLTAYELRMLIVVLDGVDEASGLKDQLEEFVLKTLAHDRIGLVITSRPEGVTLEQYTDRFVVYDLEPLNDVQQTAAIQMQIHDNVGREFFHHLQNFTHIRAEHDRIYLEVAFPTPEARATIEGFSVPNRQFLDGKGGERDREMRQKARGQQAGEWAAVSTHAEPASIYLQRLCAILTPAVLTAIDAVLEKRGSSPLRHLLQHASSGDLSVATRLALLVMKRKRILLAQSPPTDPKERFAFDYLQSTVPHTTAATLWPCIVARTDQIYTTIEDMISVFETGMRSLAELVGLAMNDLMFAPGLKDPIRLHEKALDDYVHDFKDWDDKLVVPETCVIDVIRASILCSEGGAMIRMLQAKQRGFEVEVDGKIAKLSLLRAKNSFADGGRKEPTRFRRINANVILEYDGRRVVTELQLHHRAIRRWNEESHAHDDYEYFRGKLARRYEKDMDAMLERMLLFLAEASGIPVLLSMLVLLFANGDVSAETLPTNRLELYSLAIEKVLHQRCTAAEQPVVRETLSRVAFANQRAGKREFSSNDVHKLMGEADRVLWSRLEDEPQGVPLIKTLATSVDGFSLGSPAQYQFRHLSFQEGLCALMLTSDAISPWLSDSKHVRELLVHGLNVVRIGFTALAKRLPSTLDLSSSKDEVSDEAMGILGDALLLSTERQVCAVKCNAFNLRADSTALELAGSNLWTRIKPGTATLLASILRFHTALNEINLCNNPDLGAKGGIAIAKALEVNTSLKTLILLNNSLGDDGGIAIAKALEVNLTLSNLHVNHNNLSPSGGRAIAEMLKVNTAITSIDMGFNHLDTEGAKSIAEMLRVNTSLKTLIIDRCKIGPEGGIVISEALKVNTALTKINMGFNGMDGDAKKALRMAVKGRRGGFWGLDLDG